MILWYKQSTEGSVLVLLDYTMGSSIYILKIAVEMLYISRVARKEFFFGSEIPGAKTNEKYIFFKEKN